MNNFRKIQIQQMIYDKSKEEILKDLEEFRDAEELYVFAYNYNWDNGFTIPKKILEKECCELSTALMMFYSADGIRYLKEKKYSGGVSKEWYLFIKDLYEKIKNRKFVKGNIKFIPPLNKVQLFTLKKNLGEDEMVFIQVFGDEELNIVV